jgi:hypothetical protein
MVGGQPAQVKEIEAAALRAAHDGALQIENAMAAAADKVPGLCSHHHLPAALATRSWVPP